MKLSTRSTYGMRALVELALSPGHGPLSAAVIAQRQHLSLAYLEQLLHRLKRQGIVTSLRGPRGGYVLALPPQRMAIGQIVSALDGLTNGDAGSVRVAEGRSRPARHLRGMPRVMAHGKRSLGHGMSGDRTAANAENVDEGRARFVVQAIWRCVYERLAESLRTVTLQDVCDEVRALAGQPLARQHALHL